MMFPRPAVHCAGLMALVMFAVAGCAASGEGPEREASMSPLGAVPAVSHRVTDLDSEAREWVDDVLVSLTLEQAVGQLVFPWLSGAYAAEDDPEFLEAVEWVERSGIGGVVISIGTPLAYAAKLNELQRRADVPLLVTSDFENGGPGMRINHTYALPTLLSQGGGTSFPPTMAFGAIGDEETVAEFARITAREARAVGVHLNFAPVLDVNSNPENPIINTRAFGEDPQDVARLGRAYIRGAREGGVLATAKHFPGHGDTRVDSHLILPEVTADRARLDRIELVPFRAAVDAGVDAVMTAHVSVPGILGPDAPPATLSPEFMTDLLREDLGFTGLLFTDALRMGAITAGYGGGEAAVLALEAGADVIVVPESVTASIESVVAAVEEGRLDRARIDASVRRILEAKARVGLHRERTVSLEAVTRRVGTAGHRAAADRMAASSITLPRDSRELIPLDPETINRVLSITYAESADLVAGREFDAVLSPLVADMDGVRIGPATGESVLDSLVTRADSFDVVLVNAYVPPRAGAGTVALPDPVREFVTTLAGRVPTVLVSLGNPYLLNAVPTVGSYLVAWGDREVSQRAAARAIAGATSIAGRLPITLPGLHDRGDGLEREAIPAIAALGDRRGDALDEAGLLRSPEPDDDEPEPAGDADGQDTPDVQDDAPGGAGALRGVGGGGPGDLRGVAPATGTPAPESWRTLPVSPAEASPAAVGMDRDALDALDAFVERAIGDSVSPGVALAVVRRGRVVRLRGYGRLDWDPGSPPVTPFSLYDLASLTKPVATTTAVMLLHEQGLVDLEDRVVDILPGFARGDPRKETVTLRHLLRHTSGLPPFAQFFMEHTGIPEIREAVYDLPLRTEPGSEAEYSDIGFMTLAWVVEAVTGEDFDAFLERAVFAPLGMTATGFNPDSIQIARTAPTERDTEWRPYHIRGEVHDENAFALGGVAGHAGLFSTLQDLTAFAGLIANGGVLEACAWEPGAGFPCATRGAHERRRLLSPTTVAAFTTRQPGPGSHALGWDTPSGRSSAGDYFSTAAFGHTGFTGTSIWVDPELEILVVLLTNRVNPTRENSRHVAFRRAVHDAVALAVTDRDVRPRDGR
ncbi:MAG: glycoside hydrolase family 3 N-terminal domain-containing protein [Gemmatimonadota bacterium]